MSQHIDMSLDDIIKQNKTQRLQERSFKRPKPAQARNHQRTRPLDKPQKPKPAPQTTEKTGLFVTNLHFDVTNAQLRERCGAVGRLKRLGINWDKLGRSKGTAEVEYVDPEDAKKAITELDGLELEGRKIGVRYAREQAE